MRQKLFMETTSIEPDQTAGEILRVLSKAKARSITNLYSLDGELTGLAFTLIRGEREFCYELPVRVEPVFKILNGDRDGWGRYSQTSMATKDRAQAKRTAWRQLYRWIQAQVAMIEAGMVETQEVFLPYVMLLDANGNRVSAYENFVISADRQLTAAGDAS